MQRPTSGDWSRQLVLSSASDVEYFLSQGGGFAGCDVADLLETEDMSSPGKAKTKRERQRLNKRFGRLRDMAPSPFLIAKAFDSRTPGKLESDDQENVPSPSTVSPTSGTHVGGGGYGALSKACARYPLPQALPGLVSQNPGQIRPPPGLSLQYVEPRTAARYCCGYDELDSPKHTNMVPPPMGLLATCGDMHPSSAFAENERCALGFEGVGKSSFSEGGGLFCADNSPVNSSSVPCIGWQDKGNKLETLLVDFLGAHLAEQNSKQNQDVCSSGSTDADQDAADQDAELTRFSF